MARKLEQYLPPVLEDGLQTDKDAVLGGALSVAGATTLSGAVSTGALNSKKQVTDTGGAFATPIALTAAQSGRVVLVDDAAGLQFTLPAIGSSDIGLSFKFLVTVSITSNSFKVTAAAGDLLQGGLWTVDFDDVYTAPQGAFYEPDGSDDLIMTMNGTTQGGKRGTVVEFIATTATQWFVTGIAVGDGILATQFS
jgi:hypothetical protein